jgi:hypothetical protein
VAVDDLFDLVMCLVTDDRTLTERLAARTTNAFGRNPDELAPHFEHNACLESAYRHRGAIIIDATLPPSEVADLIIARTPC